jgi:hypothetical protein
MKISLSTYFDSRKPDVSWIKGYCRDFIDLNKEIVYSRGDIIEAVFEAGKRRGIGVIIPADFKFWDTEETFRPKYVDGIEIPLDSPLRFKKFGPQIDLKRKGVTYIKEHGFKEIFVETLTDERARKELSQKATRGLGYAGPRTGIRHIIPWGSMIESEYYYELFCNNGERIQIEVRRSGRIMAHVPSYGRIRKNTVEFETPPRTMRGNVYRVETFETRGKCSCPDAEFKEEGGKIKQDHLFERFTKYRNPEAVECRHVLSARRKVSDINIFADNIRIPPREGLKNFWLALTAKTLVGTRERAERPLKTDIDILTGNAIASRPVDQLYYL